MSMSGIINTSIFQKYFILRIKFYNQCKKKKNMPNLINLCFLIFPIIQSYG